METLAVTEDQMRVRVIVLCILHIVSLLGILPSSGRAHEPAVALETLSILDEFDIAKRGDLLLVPMTIAGKSYPFVLATNSERTIVDVRLRNLLGKSLGERTDDTSDVPRWEEFSPVPMKIGKIAVRAAQRLQCANIAMLFGETSGHDVFGVIGHDLLRDRVVQIDFDTGKLCLRAAGPKIEPPLGARRHPMFAGSNGYPTIILNVEGAGIDSFVVDTSFTGPVTLRPYSMRKLIKKGAITCVRRANFIARDGRELVQHVGRLRGLGLSEYPTVPNIRVMNSDYETVGLTFLSRFSLIFDFKNEELFMLQGARFEEPDSDDWSDMMMVHNDGRVTIKKTATNGAAELAGIRAGDVVVEVNGKLAATLTLFQIRQLLSKSDTVAMTFRREERDFRVQLQAAPAKVSSDANDDVAKESRDK